MHRGSTVLIVAIATVIALTGCVDTSATGPGPSPSGPALPSTAPTQPLDFGEATMPPEAGGQSQADALAAATTVLTTFAQPELDEDTWWAQMLPLLSQQGAIAYEGTDPAQIPVRRVTGTGVVLEGSTEVSLIVQIPTDVGPYNITLTRPSGDAPWLAERIRPAQV